MPRNDQNCRIGKRKEWNIMTPYELKRAINKHFRTTDESNLWPICGKFNATKRAIRRVRRFQAQTGTPIEGLEYWLALESELSNIVNGAI